MRANNVLGLIFANTHDNYLNELTTMRSVGSVPYGGRYRLIDFQLSAMVNSYVGKVGIITKSNYQSLMDHVGHGRAWDLSRKNGGLYILPPFNTTAASGGVYSGKIQALSGAMDFVSYSDEEYVLMSDSNVVYNFDFDEMFRYHEKKEADITIAYVNCDAPKIDELAEFELDDSGRVTAISRNLGKKGNYSINVLLMRKSLLERLINEASALGYKSFTEDILKRNEKKLKIFGFKTPGFVRILDSMQSYFDANMALLDRENRRQLCLSQPVYTKVKDDVPAIYGLDSHVSNSLIADGCTIEGTVENCVLFRGVHVGKGTKVKNCVLMQNTFVSDNVTLNCVVTDKNVVIKPQKNLSGDESFPVYIGKGIVI